MFHELKVCNLEKMKLRHLIQVLLILGLSAATMPENINPKILLR